jgi:F-box/leucine-rich repeat protein 2/20
MHYVGAGCPNLNHLNIELCTQLTNKSTEYVCTGCQKLKYLDIQRCPEMTDDVLENIFKSKELEVLKLSWNPHILGIHFLLIPTNLVHLTELHVHGCHSLDEKRMDKLKEEMPHLKIIGNYTNNEETDIDLVDATFFISQLM